MADVGIKVYKKSNLYNAILYYFDVEKVNYELISDNYDYDTVIFIGYDGYDGQKLKVDDKTSVIIISDRKIIIDDNYRVNYIVTDLVNDHTQYTEVQREYLFKNGIYHILIQKVSELIENVDNYNGIIYDLTAIKTQPYNWIFKFDSIHDTYSWLSRMNKTTSHNFIQKNISFYSSKVYDDSVKEINYLTELIMNIKSKKKMIDIFILNDEEYSLLRMNYFFKSLLNNISDTYAVYLVHKDEIMKDDCELLNKLTDGVIIYEHCVYRDTYYDEFSLGVVDCKKEVVQEYNEYFDYILKKYGKKLKADGELDV